jgi:hypothetical protein
MNGIYQPLINYITEEQSKEINKILSKRNEELEFRVKNFFDKYSDTFINYLIKEIKECNIAAVCDKQYWVFAYNINGSDIKILDPKDPDTAIICLNAFFKICCEVLKVEFEKSELANQDGDRIEFTITIKNPLNKITEKNIYEMMKK